MKYALGVTVLFLDLSKAFDVIDLMPHTLQHMV